MYRNPNDIIMDSKMTDEEYEASYCGFMKDDAEIVLNDKLSEDEFESMLKDWKAFTWNSMKYKNSIVVDMVKQWLVDFRAKKN